MDIREVDKKIRACLGGAFTGKAVVRFIKGEIVACDVGSVEKPIPLLDHTERMKRVIEPTGPHWRDYLTDNERKELAEVEARLDEAKRVAEARDETWAEAERAWMQAERGEYDVAGRDINYRPDAAKSAAVGDLQAASNNAHAAWQQARDLQGEVMVEKSRVERRVYARANRRMKRDTEPEAAAAAPVNKPWRDRLKAAVTTSSVR